MKRRNSQITVAILSFTAGSALSCLLLSQNSPNVPPRPNDLRDSSRQTPSHPGIPYYESLNLSSPEHVVQGFVRAWQIDDFLTAYLLLAPQTESAFYIKWNTGDTEPFLTDKEAVSAELKKVEWNPDRQEFPMTDAMAVFQLFTSVAKATGNLPMRLDTPVTIETTQTVDMADGTTAADVHTSFENDAPIVFRTIQSPGGRWRIMYLILPDTTWPVRADDRFLTQPVKRVGRARDVNSNTGELKRK